MRPFRSVLVPAVLAAAVLSALPSPAAPAYLSAASVKVFFPRGDPGNRCNRVFAVQRKVARPAVLAGAMRALLAGPTAAERTRGYGGWFSAKTAKALRKATIVRGVAYVNFESFSRVIPNASTSCGSALLLAQLDRTAKQFPGVTKTVYSFDGSRRAFYEWLQLVPP